MCPAVQDPLLAHRPRVAVVPPEGPYLARVIDRDAVELVEVPALVDAAWVTASAGAIDLLHLHQGMAERMPLGDPAELMAATRRERVPVMLTLHQPPPRGAGVEDPVLDVLVPAADTAIVHSPPAGGIVRMRWSVDCLVLPHPHVAPLERVAAVRSSPRASGPWRVGLLPCGSQRDTEVMDVAAATIATEHGVVVDTPAGDARPDDPMTQDWVAQLDLLVVPPGRCARPSWLELCRDLATGCVVPADGAEVTTGALASYPGTDASPEIVARAVARALSALPVAPLPVEERQTEAALVRHEHVALYRALLAAGTHLDEGRPHDQLGERPW